MGTVAAVRVKKHKMRHTLIPISGFLRFEVVDVKKSLQTGLLKANYSI